MFMPVSINVMRLKLICLLVLKIRKRYRVEFESNEIKERSHMINK